MHVKLLAKNLALSNNKNSINVIILLALLQGILTYTLGALVKKKNHNTY